MYGIHWFRRDLRITGNAGLQWNWKTNESKTVGFFSFDKDFLGRPDFSHNRFQFFLETLKTLRDELREAGSDLLFLDKKPDDAFTLLLTQLKEPPEWITWNRDYEPYARERDNRIAKLLDSQGVKNHSERDHLILEPHEVSKESDPQSVYKVFTPFRKRWLEIFKLDSFQQRIENQKKALNTKPKPGTFQLNWKKLGFSPSDSDLLLESYLEKNKKKVFISIPKTGFASALEKSLAFQKKIKDYGEKRDIPSLPGTSQLSPYFKNGSFTTSQTVAALNLSKLTNPKLTAGNFRYFSEIIWREFYYHILYHFPNVEKEAFLPEFRKIAWENNETFFLAWKEGLTGYPIVDAGMRQLKATGWMHNRVRMIVASFLTKDLLIDWKWGEKYFMEVLLDGDLAPNNGGWQWAASTGCDPQPYFRIFNPILQSKKFDPQAIYIKTYLPELKNIPPELCHEPSDALWKTGYPTPIVDHAIQREKALKLYSKK